MDNLSRLQELKDQGFTCSQILVQMGLELQGKNSPELLKAARGLSGGLGFSGGICGALTGGACFLGLYAGKGRAEEEQDERLDRMVTELVDWFEETFASQYGGIECDTLLDGNMPANGAQRCPRFVSGVYQKVKELLVENGYELSGTPEDE